MSVQAIVYSAATGRVRRVLDPQANVPNVLAFIAQAHAQTGEAVLVYTKQGSGADNLNAWQAAVTAHTGKTPSGDRYCIIDATNKIVGVVIADPACDSVPNCALVAHATADANWSYDGAAFTPPPNLFITPGRVTLALGGQQQFTATLQNGTATTFTWSVNGVVGGNASLGLISPTGLYVVPLVNPGVITISVASSGGVALTASTTVTLQ